MNLDEININTINDFIFYRIAEINKNNELYIEIRVVITSDEVKYKDIILSKYFVIKNILYYLNRL